MVVGWLRRLDSPVPTIQDLGCRHAVFGVVDRDYDTVGAALIWTLEQGLGQTWTDEVREAWATSYDTLARVMREAAMPAHAAA